MSENVPAPPRAKKVPTTRTHHGDTFTDNYEWMRDKDNPEVIEHLEAENAYTDALTESWAPLREDIFNEIKARTKETDLSVPWRKGDWWYFTRSTEGKQYLTHARVPARNTGDAHTDWTPPTIDPEVMLDGEERLLDENAEAEGHTFFSLGGATVSEDGTLFAYAADYAGDERYTIRFKNLETGEYLADVIENAFWAPILDPNGGRVFYTTMDESWRPWRVYSHVFGTLPEEDELLYQEDDVAMWTGPSLSDDDSLLMISIGNSEVSETRVLDLTDPDATLTTLIPRDEGLLYEAQPVSVDGVDCYLMVHNRDAINNMVSLVVTTELSKPLDEQVWNAVVPHRNDVKVDGLTLTESHAAISLRRDTIPTVEFIPVEGIGTAEQQPGVEPEFGEKLFTLAVSRADFSAPVVRLSYQSYFTPPQVLDYFLGSSQLVLRKETEVLGGYHPDQYVAEQMWATARDGAKIPVTLVRSTRVRPGANPGIIYGYGSYEMSMDPFFSAGRLSLLDRGIVFAIAHVRGGGEMGRGWYEDGKKLRKRNSFTDFVDVTDFVAGSGWVDPARLGAAGASAGGLLMGAVANLAPQKYAAVVARVPFVDALTTILDPDLPLSALEWEEWGNPIEDAEAYAYMKSYTPYENIRAVAYPRILALTSLNDTRVLYVEPAKWVAQLREVSVGDEPVLLRTVMDGGHGGASGRYEKWREFAWEFGFLADAIGARALR